MIDPINLLTTTTALTNGTQTNAFTGTVVDAKDYVGKVQVSFHVGTETTTGGGTLALRVENNSANVAGGWVGVTSNGTLPTVTIAGHYSVGIDTREAYRYLRVAGQPASGKCYPLSATFIGRKQVI